MEMSDNRYSYAELVEANGITHIAGLSGNHRIGELIDTVVEFIQ